MSNTTKKSKTLLQLHQAFTAFLCSKSFKIPQYLIKYQDITNNIYYVNRCNELNIWDYYQNINYTLQSIVNTQLVLLFPKVSFLDINIYIDYQSQNINWDSLQKTSKTLQNIKQTTDYYYQKKIINTNRINYFLEINNHLCNFLTVKKKFQNPRFFTLYKKMFVYLLLCSYRYNFLTPYSPTSRMVQLQYQLLI